MPRLLELANIHKSDKGDVYGSCTTFAALYEHLLNNIADKDVKLLEIGLNNGGPEHGSDRFDRTITDAPSIRMWLDYFPKGDIWGFDINKVTSELLAALPRFYFFRGDQGDIISYQMLEEEIKATYQKDSVEEMFDIIIDDGSHAFYHQQMSFVHMSKLVKPGGFYIIEDLDWQPDEKSGGSKAGGFAPYDKSLLPETVNTKKLFYSLFPSALSDTDDYIQPATEAQFRDEPNAYKECEDPIKAQKNLHLHIELLNEYRPEYSHVLLNEAKKYDRLEGEILNNIEDYINRSRILVLRKRK